MIEQLQSIDVACFSSINGLHGIFMDHAMWLVSGKLSWLLLLLAVLYVGWRKGWRTMLLLVLAIGLAILLADQLSSGLIKHLVERPRPSHNHELDATIHLVNGYRGGAYGFVSSHAANSLATCLFLCLILRNAFTTVTLMLWTLLQCYSRIYLGVHYPGDIAGGLIVGAIVAFIVYWFWNWASKRYLHADPRGVFTHRDARLVANATWCNLLIITALATIFTFATT